MTVPQAQLTQTAVERLEAFLADERRQRTRREHDGRLAEVCEAGGGLFLYSYDAAGDLAEIQEADGGRVSFAYDEQRRLSLVRDERFGTTRYRYGESGRLSEVEDDETRVRFEHDEAGRLVRALRGTAGAVVYEYDAEGRVTRARTAACSTEHVYDGAGRVAEIRQTLGGVPLTLSLSYDAGGRLAEVRLPGSGEPVVYEWDERGRPSAVRLGRRPFARFEYDGAARSATTRFASGVVERSFHDAAGGRALRREVVRGGEVLARRVNEYHPEGRLRSDGERSYEYDALGRLARARSEDGGGEWVYEYDSCDNLLQGARELSYDRRGRLASKCSRGSEHAYRYDDAGQLTEVLRDGETRARFIYDHKGRLAASEAGARRERYLYGPGDELFAVTDWEGSPLRLLVRTPFGCVGEVRGPVESGAAFAIHQDERGGCFLLTDEDGRVAARPGFDPFGAPLSEDEAESPHTFGGRRWVAEVGLYYFGARWYDPEAGRFLTPDTYTARPDDARVVNPLCDAAAQAGLREAMLPGWLARPRLRNRYAFCANDPVNCFDPNGHWSFGYVLLSVLGAIWTLPNTVFGLLVEITCLVGEVLRWFVWVFTAGNVSWATPGFDAAASGRLNAYALVFEGGWLGSIRSILGITFGNVFFVYKDWRTEIANSGLPDPVQPDAYVGTDVKIPREDVLYEHELRHTFQYQLLGPFFHLGIPLWGAYEWEVICFGYEDAWMERDARRYGGY
ncbi:MAG TPA: RHS repeat-associated core domain-containing protein [Pyrinomonadaceae bacterium]|nr:RHS repeat-associated core domain-containing protein [Pyrinomonadaceae bacterium]